MMDELTVEVTPKGYIIRMNGKNPVEVTNEADLQDYIMKAVQNG